MAALVDQLRQLRSDLVALVDSDEEQEVTGIALHLVDAVLSEARVSLPPESTLSHQIVDLISADSIAAEDPPVRAADALVVVGQLLAVLDRAAREQDEQLLRSKEHDKALLGQFLTLLPNESGAAAWLRQHPFEVPFTAEDEAALDTYWHDWDNAPKRFQVPALAAAERTFREALGEFRAHLRTVAFRLRDGSYRVYPDHDLDWETKDNAFAIQAVREADRLARQAWRAYQALVEAAVRLL